MEILVLTVSDRASKGIYEDLCGPALEKMLKGAFENVIIHRKIVPDEQNAIIDAYNTFVHCNFIITTGGTGISPRDVTPDATKGWCDRIVEGVGDYLRMESIKQTKNAVLSRAVAAIKGSVFVVNFPGSLSGATYCLELFIPLMPHIVKMIAGEGHK